MRTAMLFESKFEIFAFLVFGQSWLENKVQGRVFMEMNVEKGLRSLFQVLGGPTYSDNAIPAISYEK